MPPLKISPGARFFVLFLENSFSPKPSATSVGIV